MRFITFDCFFFSSVFGSASTKAGLLGDRYTYIFFCESIFQVIAGDDSFLDCFHMLYGFENLKLLRVSIQH